MIARLSLILLFACGTPPSADVDSGVDIDAPPEVDASTMQTVTFTYTPAWSGVVSVDVIGGFGQGTDWTAPFVTLTGSSGTFTATAQLAAGQYPYLFHVVGDADAGTKAATFERFAIDPASAGFIACPAESPTYTPNNANPCGQLAVPQTAATTYHVTGTVKVNGAPAAGFLVVLEREELASHHFFANRATTGTDGTYDLSAATGSYRIVVQHPQFEAKTDDQLDPKTLNVLRRELSSRFAVSADVAMSVSEVGFANYATFAPVTTATLPTTFTFGTGAPTHLDVYGTAMGGKGKSVGDPWFASAITNTGSASFDGTFTTPQKGEPAVVLGERYFWGVEQVHAPDADGVVWTGQSMVMPLTWH